MRKNYPYPQTLQALLNRGENEEDALQMIEEFAEELFDPDFKGDPYTLIGEHLSLDADYCEEFFNEAIRKEVKK